MFYLGCALCHCELPTMLVLQCLGDVELLLGVDMIFLIDAHYQRFSLEFAGDAVRLKFGSDAEKHVSLKR